MIHELERDFTRFVKLNSKLTKGDWALVLTGSLALAAPYVLAATSDKIAIQSTALAVLMFLFVVLLFIKQRTERSKWSKRIGITVASLDGVISCIEEEHARYVASHPEVNGDVEKVEAGIEYLQALDASVQASSEPFIPPASISILRFLLTTVCAGSFGSLLQRGEIR